MNGIKIIKIFSICLTLIVLSFCKDSSKSKIERKVEKTYVDKNDYFAKYLTGKYFIIDNIIGCETKNQIKSVMLYREIDCSSCIERCHLELDSRSYYEELAIIKLGYLNKKDSILFRNFREIFSDESDYVYNTYGFFPTPIVLDIRNQKIIKCHFCY